MNKPTTIYNAKTMGKTREKEACVLLYTQNKYWGGAGSRAPPQSQRLFYSQFCAEKIATQRKGGKTKRRRLLQQSAPSKEQEVKPTHEQKQVSHIERKKTKQRCGQHY